MAWFSIVPLIGTTDGDGAVTIKSTRAVNGMLYSLHEDKGSLANGVDMTLSIIDSEHPKTILTLTNADTDNTVLFPRGSSCSNTGTVSTDQNLMIPVVGTLQLVIAQGGATKTGGLYAYVME